MIFKKINNNFNLDDTFSTLKGILLITTTIKIPIYNLTYENDVAKLFWHRLNLKDNDI